MHEVDTRQHLIRLEEIWAAAQREQSDPAALPWDKLRVDDYTWEEREAIAYWWTLLSVLDASAPPVFAAALIKTYQDHEEDPVRRCFFSVTRDEQTCGLAITTQLGHPDPLRYEPKRDPASLRSATRSGCTTMVCATWRVTSRRWRSTASPCSSPRS